ncbi:MAG: TetR/AcrR family transcriptional regulator [Bacteroidales bacterium]|jgi:AcrR family transcriptional regulator
MQDSKEHIVLIASKLFLQKNFKEVTMKEIVKETGLSKGAFYHYFKSKEQLFLEVLNYFFSHVSRDYKNYSKESLNEFYHDYANETINLTKKYLAKFEDELNEVTITMNYFSLVFDALKLFPEFRERIISEFNDEIGYWTEAVERARRNGEISSPMSDKEIAEIFMYLSDGVGMHMIMRGETIENMVKPFENLWNKFYEQIKV